jgi:hypothetical protein
MFSKSRNTAIVASESGRLIWVGTLMQRSANRHRKRGLHQPPLLDKMRARK